MGLDSNSAYTLSSLITGVLFTNISSIPGEIDAALMNAMLDISRALYSSIEIYIVKT